MALNAAWWTALGAAARWVADFTGVSSLRDARVSTDFYTIISLGEFPRCFLAPCQNNAESQDPGLDTGHMYAVNLWPMLLSCRVQMAAAATSVSISDSVWSHTGKIRYRVVRISDSAVMGTSSYYPATDAKAYATAITIGGLTAGVDYKLEAWIDATPDVSGYTEGWYKTLIEWTAPASGAPAIDVVGNWPQTIYALQVSLQGGGALGLYRLTTGRPQYVEIAPQPLQGDFTPIDTADPGYSAKLVTPWVYDNPDPVVGGAYPEDKAILTQWYRRDGMWDMYHYQPWAYFGTPPAVIAAIALQAGLAAAWIDQTLCSSADDAYTSDAPWSSLAAVPTLYASRKIGRTVADLVYDVIRHTRDLLAVTMAGKLAVISRTRPPTLATLTADDGVLAVEHGLTLDHLFNAATARFCSGFRQWGADGFRLDMAEATFACTEERALDSYAGDKWDVACEDTTSQGKHGRVDLPGTKESRIVGGVIKERVLASYPYWLDAAIGQALLVYWIGMDATPRREMRVRQTLLGCDYDVGTKITAATITGDGATVANLFCIEKEIDFDEMRVDSVLLEDPSI